MTLRFVFLWSHRSFFTGSKPNTTKTPSWKRLPTEASGCSRRAAGWGTLLFLSDVPSKRTLQPWLSLRNTRAASWLLVILSLKSCEMGISHLSLLIVWLFFFSWFGCWGYIYTFSLHEGPSPGTCLDSVDLNFLKLFVIFLVLFLAELKWAWVVHLHPTPFSLGYHNRKTSSCGSWNLSCEQTSPGRSQISKRKKLKYF